MTENEKLEPGKIKNVLEDDYFRLVLEERVRDRTDAYLKRMGAFALVLLTVAGFSSWDLVEKAKEKYEAEVSELQKAQDKLQEGQKELLEREAALEQRSQEVQQSALNVQRDAMSVTKSAFEAEASSQAARGASRTAANNATRAKLSADGVQTDAVKVSDNVRAVDIVVNSAKKEAVSAANAAADATKASENAILAARNMTETAGQLKRLLPAQIQLMMAKESQQLLVRGKKTPCIELRNWIQPDVSSLRDEPNRFYVRFRVRHIHLHPVDLFMQVMEDSCPVDEGSNTARKRPVSAGKIYEYHQLPKSPQSTTSVDAHPIPGTPFVFRMTFVYDPLLTYDFVVLALSPEENLIKTFPDYNSPDYDDLARSATKSTDAFR